MKEKERAKEFDVSRSSSRRHGGEEKGANSSKGPKKLYLPSPPRRREIKKEPASPREERRSPPRRKRPPLDSQRDAYAEARRSDRDRDRRHWDERRRDYREGRDQNWDRTEEPAKEYQWGLQEHQKSTSEEKPEKEKEKPSLALSGKLAEESNTFMGVVIKYNEPPESRKPTVRWRLYPFKGDEALKVLYVHRQSAYLIGKDRKIADIPIDHPSCSKQHAALQYRSMPFERPDGSKARRVRPYLIDLESSNGSFINGVKMEPRRYYELKERDVIKFAYSSREYVVLNENSAEALTESSPSASPNPSGEDEESETEPEEEDPKPKKVKKEKKKKKTKKETRSVFVDEKEDSDEAQDG